MEATLLDLCKRHGLYCINVQFLADTKPCFCVFVHWSEPGTVRCVSGRGETFDAAFDASLVNLATARPGPVFTADLPSTDDAYAAMGWDTSLRGKDATDA